MNPAMEKNQIQTNDDCQEISMLVKSKSNLHLGLVCVKLKFWTLRSLCVAKVDAKIDVSRAKFLQVTPTTQQ